MLYTIFGLLLVSPLFLLVGSLSRTAVAIRRGEVASGALPETVVHRAAKRRTPSVRDAAARQPAQATNRTAQAHPRMGGRTRPAVDGGNRRDFFGDRLLPRDDDDNVVLLPLDRGSHANDEDERRLQTHSA